MNRNIFTTTLLICINIVVCAQSDINALDKYMQEVREGSNLPIPNELLNTDNETRLFENIQPYLADSLNNIRAKAYYIVKLIGQKSTSPEVKNIALNTLIAGIDDSDTGISGYASESLAGFKKKDFSNDQRQALEGLVNKETPHLDLVLKVAGYIEISKERFDAIINSNLPFKYKWAAQLALARMGDQNAIDYILNKLQQAPINDDFVYDFVPDLVYTRQLELYKFLEVIIQSEEMNCSSANPDANTKILCGYRVMEYLAPVIENFPLPIDEFGEIDVDNYENALTVVREWLVQNTNYLIKNDTY